MKIKQNKSSKYKPITITLETEEEALSLFGIVAGSSSKVVSGDLNTVYNKIVPQLTIQGTINSIHDTLEDILNIK